MADGRSFRFSENNLAALIKKGQDTKVYSRHKGAHYILLTGQEKAVEVLESLAGNGYQPDDNLRFELVTNHGKRPESSNAEANAENQCQGIVQEIENKIREVGPGEYPQWPEKINEIIADDGLAEKAIDNIHKIA
ncbi:3545_t:CDS:2, partial [Racocetra persica]